MTGKKARCLLQCERSFMAQNGSREPFKQLPLFGAKRTWGEFDATRLGRSEGRPGAAPRPRTCYDALAAGHLSGSAAAITLD